MCTLLLIALSDQLSAQNASNAFTILDSIFKFDSIGSSLTLFGETHVVNATDLLSLKIHNDYIGHKITHFFIEQDPTLVEFFKEDISEGDTHLFVNYFDKKGQIAFWDEMYKYYCKKAIDSIPIYGIDIIESLNTTLRSVSLTLHTSNDPELKELDDILWNTRGFARILKIRKIINAFDQCREALWRYSKSAYYTLDIIERQCQLSRFGKIKSDRDREKIIAGNFMFWYKNESPVRGFCSIGRWHVIDKEVKMGRFSGVYKSIFSLKKPVFRSAYLQLKENEAIMANVNIKAYALAYCLTDYRDCSKWPRDNWFSIHPRYINSPLVLPKDRVELNDNQPRYGQVLQVIAPNENDLNLIDIIEPTSFE